MRDPRLVGHFAKHNLHTYGALLVPVVGYLHAYPKRSIIFNIKTLPQIAAQCLPECGGKAHNDRGCLTAGG